jgi:hypothetical protein
MIFLELCIMSKLLPDRYKHFCFKTLDEYLSVDQTQKYKCPKNFTDGEPLWLSSKVFENEKINEIERTQVRSPPRATSFF